MEICQKIIKTDKISWKADLAADETIVVGFAVLLNEDANGTRANKNYEKINVCGVGRNGYGNANGECSEG